MSGKAASAPLRLFLRVPFPLSRRPGGSARGITRDRKILTNCGESTFAATLYDGRHRMRWKHSGPRAMCQARPPTKSVRGKPLTVGRAWSPAMAPPLRFKAHGKGEQKDG